MSKKGLVRIIAGCLTVVITAAAVVAAPSPTRNGAVSQDFMINGEKADPNQYKAAFETNLEELGLDEEVLDLIQNINDNPEKLKEVLRDENLKIAEEDEIEVSALELLTQIQDLSVIDQTTGEIAKEMKNVTLTWETPNLKEGIGEIRVLHYSTAREVWEILKPEKINYEEKAITQNFEDLSPVAVLYLPADRD